MDASPSSEHNKVEIDMCIRDEISLFIGAMTYSSSLILSVLEG